jgi:hypothetical protein
MNYEGVQNRIERVYSSSSSIERTTLLGGISCPFIGTKAQFIMHGSRAYLHLIYEQSFSWKAHEQLALQGSHICRGTMTCPLWNGCHVVA